MPAKASLHDVSPFCQGALRSFSRTLLENANDKIQPQVRAACVRPSMLSNRADTDRRTQSHRAVPGPKSLPPYAGLATPDIASLATQQENESYKPASARLLSASSSRRER